MCDDLKLKNLIFLNFDTNKMNSNLQILEIYFAIILDMGRL
jgi:hypothetical protein